MLFLEWCRQKNPLTVCEGSGDRLNGLFGVPFSDDGLATTSKNSVFCQIRDDVRVEFVVRKLTHDSARLFGMTDRGTLEPGTKADVDVIDYDNLRVSHPEMIYDLPAGMPRLMQTATGHENTFVSGEVVQENGKDTGARPGRGVRST